MIKRFAKELYKIWITERPNQLAAALAYFGMFSFAPVIFIAFSVVGIFADEIAAANQFYERLESVFGAEFATFVQDSITALSNTTTEGSSILVSIISFLALLYFAAFSIMSARERRWFWATMPGKTLMVAIMADVVAGTILTFVGLPGLMPLPWWQTLAIFIYAMVSCLVVNDAVKVAMIKWRVPSAVA